MNRSTALAMAATRVAGAAMLAVLWATPMEALAEWPAVCVFRQLFGMECFGCGMTRALSAALHGELSRALEANRMAAVILPALVVWIAVPTRLWAALANTARQFRSPALRHRRA